jgi:hypothetical protein
MSIAYAQEAIIMTLGRLRLSVADARDLAEGALLLADGVSTRTMPPVVGSFPPMLSALHQSTSMAN